MNRKLKFEWVQALRSGKFLQTADRFYDAFNESFCALGLLGYLAGEDVNMIGGQTLRRIGLSESILREVVFRNDKEFQSFEAIANWVEENVPEDNTPVPESVNYRHRIRYNASLVFPWEIDIEPYVKLYNEPKLDPGYIAFKKKLDTERESITC